MKIKLQSLESERLGIEERPRNYNAYPGEGKIEEIYVDW